jgi:hypothetical protein
MELSTLKQHALESTLLRDIKLKLVKTLYFWKGKELLLLGEGGKEMRKRNPQLSKIKSLTLISQLTPRHSTSVLILSLQSSIIFMQNLI